MEMRNIRNTYEYDVIKPEAFGKKKKTIIQVDIKLYTTRVLTRMYSVSKMRVVINCLNKSTLFCG